MSCFSCWGICKQILGIFTGSGAVVSLCKSSLETVPHSEICSFINKVVQCLSRVFPFYQTSYDSTTLQLLRVFIQEHPWAEHCSQSLWHSMVFVSALLIRPVCLTKQFRSYALQCCPLKTQIHWLLLNHHKNCIWGFFGFVLNRRLCQT